MTTRILLLNGPNLNLLGLRDPHLYGSTPLPVVEKRLIEFAAGLGVELTAAQRNSEGELVTLLQDAVDSYDGAIINPGPLSHYGLSLRDVIDVIPVPVIEVHLTNIHAREEFRRHSIISAVARGTICGLGVDGYELAIRELVTLVSREV
ncbi:type II 3-dehydroquinate dehydratase [Nocardia sp. CA2R105]|uniref:type II 3-dehydroquinate dehydratase n=1 Tax=Nocardia coffeae TaxID=2873381 RepID=UPI001CA6592E|nr:type II 3-dehydroquinate dehydratase [Nocardia coffeae]MBY8856457.1 type II 3-dehydroquinate dehydratase [Nocardia coffeae]